MLFADFGIMDIHSASQQTVLARSIKFNEFGISWHKAQSNASSIIKLPASLPSVLTGITSEDRSESQITNQASSQEGV